MSKVKPCPFCGAKARIEDYGNFKIVTCSKLSMLCPNPRMTVYNDDFSHWNERIETSSEIALRETLRLKELECQQLAQDKAELVAKVGVLEDKNSLYEALSANCWDLICESESNGDDAGYGWLVIGHYMAKPCKRVLGYTNDEENPSLAIIHALETTKESQYDYLYEYK